ncbi:MAG: hypothetical protein DHS20C07_15930 [Methyloligella sp.]|nr:MAG: hypothetical protein DHS20C07_15930 [Methyloligella sp.]
MLRAVKKLGLILLLVMNFQSISMAWAEENETYLDENGVTNPEEMSIKSYIYKLTPALSRNQQSACAWGYAATIAGEYKTAVDIFRQCATYGNQASKIWMSYMYQNGLGVKKDPVKSTDWVRESAQDGYSIGEFNYGLSLLKGYGVRRNVKAGKSFIDRAAKQGDVDAVILQNSNYNPDVVTPDADQADKAPLF